MNSYNTIEEVRDYLKSYKFKEYKKTDFHKCDYCFQKTYNDEFGKRYFIDARVYDFSWASKIPEKYHIEYFCQLYQKGSHDAVDLTFIDWKLEQVEQFINEMFLFNLIEHYELLQ